jgi:glycosyltransferase involved in cell wall biosynthesis
MTGMPNSSSLTLSYRNKMTRLTIIIPTHNSSVFVPDLFYCLEQQLQSAIEVIIVDDHSADGTVSAIRELSKRSQLDIKILESKGRGPGAARNTGIRAAKTEYVCFMDSDDLLDREFSEALSTHYQDTPDIIETLFYQTDTNGEIISRSNLANHIDPVDRVNSLVNSKISMVSWGKAYRLSFLLQHNILFPEGIMNGEDHIFTLKAYRNAQIVRVVPRYLYNWRRRSGSLTKRVVTKKRLDDFFLITKMRISLFKERENVKLRQSLYLKSFKEWVQLRKEIELSDGRFAKLRIRLLLWYGTTRFKKAFPPTGGKADFVKHKDPALFKQAYQ